MSITYDSVGPLHSYYLTPIAIKRLQGNYIGSALLPDEVTPKIEFSYLYYGDIGGQTPQVSENEYGPYTNLRYEKRADLVRPYKERTRISIHALEPNTIRDVMTDHTEFLADRAALRIESERVNAVVNAAIQTASMEGFYYKDCSAKTDHWAYGNGTANPLNDLTDAIKSLRKHAKVNPNALICGPDVTAVLMKLPAFQEFQIGGMLAPKMIETGALPGSNEMPGNSVGPVGRILGLTVLESNASILSDNNNPDSPLIPLLQDDVYVLRTGRELGGLYQYGGVQARAFPDEKGDAIELQIKFWIKSVIRRRQLIYTIKEAIGTP